MHLDEADEWTEAGEQTSGREGVPLKQYQGFMLLFCYGIFDIDDIDDIDGVA